MISIDVHVLPVAFWAHLALECSLGSEPTATGGATAIGPVRAGPAGRQSALDLLWAGGRAVHKRSRIGLGHLAKSRRGGELFAVWAEHQRSDTSVYHNGRRLIPSQQVDRLQVGFPANRSDLAVLDVLGASALQLYKLLADHAMLTVPSSIIVMVATGVGGAPQVPIAVTG